MEARCQQGHARDLANIAYGHAAHFFIADHGTLEPRDAFGDHAAASLLQRTLATYETDAEFSWRSGLPDTRRCPTTGTSRRCAPRWRRAR